MTHLVERLDPEGLKHFQSHIESQESDIKLMIKAFEQEKYGWKSFEEMDASRAQIKINIAQRKIRELKVEIERQEKIISESENTIRVLKKHANNSEVKKEAKRPIVSEYSSSIAKNFVANWVRSLMTELGVKSSKQLENVIVSNSTRNTERNWRRWLKGEAIPTYNTLVILLDGKVIGDKYNGALLQSIPTNPNTDDLLTLLRFI